MIVGVSNPMTRWLHHVPAWLPYAADSGVAEDLRRGRSPWLDSIHLLWSSWVFITPLFDGGLRGYTHTWMVLTLLTYPVFLALFMGMQLVARRQVAWFPLGMLVLSFSTMPWYPSGLSYLVYACTMLAHCRMNVWRYLATVFAINALYVAHAAYLGYPSVMLVTMPGTIFVICAIIVVEQMGRQRDAALALSQEEVRRLAATAERERIGRDLHDLLGHTLSLITLKLELSRRLLDRDTEAARVELVEAERVARKALAEVRSAVTGIRATDLAAELAAARLMLEAAQVRLDYGATPVLPVPVEQALALVLREAVTNIGRHAGASQARIAFEPRRDGLQVQIADNGCGGVRAHGNGLAGMRERVDVLGGTLVIDSPPGKGTRLTIELPCPGMLPATAESARIAANPGAGAGRMDGFEQPHVAGGPA